MGQTNHRHSYEQSFPFATGSIVATPVLNGLTHDYSRGAYALTFTQIRSTTQQAINRLLMACLRLATSFILGVNCNFLQPTAHSVCLFLSLPGSFSTKNSSRSGEFYVEKPHFLGG